MLSQVMMTRAATSLSGEGDLLCPRPSDWALSLLSALSVEEGMQGVDEAGGSLRGAGIGGTVSFLLGFLSGAGGAAPPPSASTVCAQKQVRDGRGKNAATQVSTFAKDGREGDGLTGSQGVVLTLIIQVKWLLVDGCRFWFRTGQPQAGCKHTDTRFCF